MLRDFTRIDLQNAINDRDKNVELKAAFACSWGCLEVVGNRN